MIISMNGSTESGYDYIIVGEGDDQEREGVSELGRGIEYPLSGVGAERAPAIECLTDRGGGHASSRRDILHRDPRARQRDRCLVGLLGHAHSRAGIRRFRENCLDRC